MEDIFVKIQENTIGPLSIKKVKCLVDQGVFSPEDLVWSKKLGDWVPAETQIEIIELFRPARQRT